jgi:hypothetical protein
MDGGGVGIIRVIIGRTGVYGPHAGVSSSTGRLRGEEDEDGGIGVGGWGDAEEERGSKI